MGQAQQKRQQEMLKQMGARVVSEGSPSGTAQNAPPLSNTGGSERNGEAGAGNQSASDRNRVNLSVPAGVHAALVQVADTLGMTVAQTAVMAVTMGLPALAAQARAVRELSE